MIVYFSGTGNSAYAAKRIGAEMQDEVFDLFEKIRLQEHTPLSSDKPWVLVAPTYAWRIPRLVADWVRKTEFDGAREMYFVMTCGGGIGNAAAYLEELCRSKGLRYMGCAPVIMPENYIALYDTPGRKEALETIERAEKTIAEIIRCMQKGAAFPDARAALSDKVRSGLINDIFYPLIVHAKKFYATEACVSCGKCEAVCPLGNIRLENGRPVWGNRCTHCMACICRCPKEAIEYGRHSRGKARYVCPKELL